MTHTETHDTGVTGAEPAGPVAPAKARSQKGARQKSAGTQGAQAGQSGKTRARSKSKPKVAQKVPQPRAESKSAQILELIGRPKGATLAEIMRVSSWQAHSVRGFLSTATKKHRLKIASARNEAGERTYKVDC